MNHPFYGGSDLLSATRGSAPTSEPTHASVCDPPTEERPSFSDWLRDQGIHMTADEVLDVIESARRRGQSPEKLLGYPWAER
jgi:hypothetical protein